MRARSADAELVVRRAVWRRRRDGRRRAAVIAKIMAVLARLPAASARRVRAAPAARIVQVEARAAVSDIFAPDEIKENPSRTCALRHARVVVAIGFGGLRARVRRLRPRRRVAELPARRRGGARGLARLGRG